MPDVEQRRTPADGLRRGEDVGPAEYQFRTVPEFIAAEGLLRLAQPVDLRLHGHADWEQNQGVGVAGALGYARSLIRGHSIMKHSVPLLAISLTACATTDSSLAMPTQPDVQAYVTENWQYYQRDLRRSAGNYAGPLEFVGVSELQCGGRGLTVCNFQITARTETGDLVTARRSDLLGYGEDGKLGEYIIVG